MREAPYNHLYPRLTTQSNTYTVYVRAQSLQVPPGSPLTNLPENRIKVNGEYGGSLAVERYIDPADPDIPDFASSSNFGNPVSFLQAPHQRIPAIPSAMNPCATTPRTLGRNAAFSLIELLAVIAVLGILAVLVVPSMRGISSATELSVSAASIGDTLNLARQTALSVNRPVEARFYEVPHSIDPTPAARWACMSPATPSPDRWAGWFSCGTMS